MNFDEWWEESEDNSRLASDCERLLASSTYDHDTISELEQDLWHYSEEELNELKANLYANQVDRINAGLNYNMTDIRRKLRTEI